MAHLVAIPLPVATGLLVDLIEALEVHAEALQVDTDGQVLTIAVSSTTEDRVPGGAPARSSVPPPPLAPPDDPAPELAPAGLAEPPPSSAARVESPPGPPLATGIVDDVLAAAVELSGFDVEQLRTSATREASAWRYASVAVAHDRGASDLSLATQFDQGTQRLRTMRARVHQNPSRYQSKIDQLVAHLDGAAPAAASSSEPVEPSQPEPTDRLSRLQALVDVEPADDDQELTEYPPPPPSFPTPAPIARRPFDPDAARAAAGAAL